MLKLIKKNTIRKISNSKKRFISILIITFLGTGIFVGLKSTSSNMLKTLDSYLDKANNYDIKIISSLGLTDKDISAIKNLSTIEQVTGAYFKDVMVDLGETKSVIQLNSINNNINNIELSEGRLPIKNNEILVEPALINRKNGIKIGDFIEVNDTTLEVSKFQIVGTAKSSIYIGPETYSGSRGITKIGNGNINYYAYVLEDAIKADYYPVIYITVKDAKNQVTNSDKYKEIIKNAMSEIEAIKDENEKIRYSDIFTSVNDKINSKISEGEKELGEFKTQLEIAEKELQKGNNELENSKALLQKKTTELENAKKQLDEATKIIDEKTTELEKYKKQIEETKLLINEKKSELAKANSLLCQNKEKLDSVNNELTKAKELIDENKHLLEEKKTELDLAKYNIDKSKNELNKNLEPYNFSYDKIKNIKNYIDTSSERKEKVISYIPKNIPNHDRVVEFISKIYDTTSDEIFEYVYKYSNILDSFIQGMPTSWKSHDIIVSFLKAIKGRIDDVYSINVVVNVITKGEEEYQKYQEQYNEAQELFDSKITEYNDQKILYEEALKKYEEANKIYLAGKNEFVNKEEEYKNAFSMYLKWLKEFEKFLEKYEKGYEQYLIGENEIKTGKNKWNEAYALYLSKKEEYNINLEKYDSIQKEFQDEVKQAKGELEKVPESVWYLYVRDDDRNYNSFLDANNSIINLSKIFPIIFFALTIFVCMINMSRMVDEDRKEIGILKALGTEKKYIKINYLLYAFFGTIIGSIIGAILGFYLLPIYIWNAYSVAFDIPIYEISYNLIYIILGVIISTVLVEITTLFATRKVLNESIVSLNRPKLPKAGKKIFVENLPFIKRLLSFKSKLIIRNLFIYKKKILMTLLSTIGGLLLIMIGLSIKYSITNIVDLEYGKLNTSDLTVLIDDNTSDTRIEEIFSDDRISSYQKMNVSTVTTMEYYEVYLQAIDNPHSTEINYYDSKTGEKLNLVDGEVIVSCKLAELLDKDISDTIEIILDDNSKKYLKISGISESHWGHTISMNKATYEKEFGNYYTNAAYVTLKDKTEDNNLMELLKQQKEIQSIMSIKDFKQQIDNILSPLNKIVVLLIILSGLLTVVVLYNLSIINISERKKEITTLKILGFTKKELDHYIITEMIILTIIGIIIGLLIGKEVCMFLVKGLEIEKARYVYEMMPQTYIYSTVIMISFIITTSIFTHFALKKIKLKEK